MRTTFDESEIKTLVGDLRRFVERVNEHKQERDGIAQAAKLAGTAEAFARFFADDLKYIFDVEVEK